MEKINTTLSGFAADIGAEAGPGTHGGNDVEKPEGMPDRRDADYSVTSPRELDNALSDDNAVVYVSEDIDLADWGESIWAGDGVKLISDYCNPDVPGTGPVIRHRRTDDDVYTRKCIRHRGGKPLEMYGVFAHGPRTDYFDPDHNAPEFQDLTSSFLHEHAPADSGTFRAVGCRLTGWTMAGIELGAKNYETDAEIRYSTFDRNRMWHLGYGIEQYNGDLWVDRCYFDACRHAIAGFGRPTEQTDVTNCVFGLGPWYSHAVDQHRLGENVTDGGQTAGQHLRVRNCTFLGRHGDRGNGPYDQEGIAWRGESVNESQVYNCEFVHPTEPDAPGQQGSAVRQSVDGSNDWVNLSLWNNTYGQLGKKAGVGAPRAKKGHEDDDEPIEEDPSGQPNQPEPTMKRLKVRGHGGPGVEGDYSIIVHGDVEPTDQNEPSEQIEDLDGERTRISGNMWGGVDVFLLADDALPVSAESKDVVLTIWLDDVPIMGGLTAVESARRFDEQQSQIDQVRDWVDSRLRNLRVVVGGGSE